MLCATDVAEISFREAHTNRCTVTVDGILDGLSFAHFMKVKFGQRGPIINLAVRSDHGFLHHLPRQWTEEAHRDWKRERFSAKQHTHTHNSSIIQTSRYLLLFRAQPRHIATHGKDARRVGVTPRHMQLCIHDNSLHLVTDVVMPRAHVRITNRGEDAVRELT